MRGPLRAGCSGWATQAAASTCCRCHVPPPRASRLTPCHAPRASSLTPCHAPRATRLAPCHAPRTTRHPTRDARLHVARRRLRAPRDTCATPAGHAADGARRTAAENRLQLRAYPSAPPLHKHTLTMCARACAHTHTHTHTRARPHARENATRAVVRHSRHDRHQMTGTVGYYGVLDSTQGRRAARLRRRRRRPLILRQRPRRPPPLRHARTAAHGSMYAAPLWAGPVGSQAPEYSRALRQPVRSMLRAVGPSLPPVRPPARAAGARARVSARSTRLSRATPKRSLCVVALDFGFMPAWARSCGHCHGVVPASNP